jgi:hypothetical protein
MRSWADNDDLAGHQGGVDLAKVIEHTVAEDAESVTKSAARRR